MMDCDFIACSCRGLKYNELASCTRLTLRGQIGNVTQCLRGLQPPHGPFQFYPNRGAQDRGRFHRRGRLEVAGAAGA